MLLLSKDKCTKIYRCENTKATVVFVDDETDCYSFVCGVKNIYDSNKGLPHIIEHMIYGGTKKNPFDDAFLYMEENFSYAYLNAITFKDFTTYLCSSKNLVDFESMVDIHLDFIFKPSFRLEKFQQEIFSKEHETGAMYNEMLSMYEDEDYKLESDTLASLFFDYRKYNPHGLPFDIKKVDFEDVVKYYKEVYKPSNMIFIFHNVKDEITHLNKIEKYFVDSDLYKDEKEHIIDEVSLVNFTDEFFFKKIKIHNHFEKSILEYGFEYLNTMLEFDSPTNGFKTYKTKGYFIVYAFLKKENGINDIYEYIDSQFHNVTDLNSFINKKFFLYSNKDFGYKTDGIFLGIEQVENYFLFNEVHHLDLITCLKAFNYKNFLFLLGSKKEEKNKMEKNVTNYQKKFFLDSSNYLNDKENTKICWDDVGKRRFDTSNNRHNIQNSFFCRKDFYFIAKSDIIVLICTEKYEAENGDEKNNLIYISLLIDFYAKSNDLYKHIVDFSCDAHIFNKEVYLKYYLVGTKKEVLFFLEDLAKVKKLFIDDFLKFVKSNKDFSKIKNLYGTNFSRNIITEIKEPMESQMYICSENDISEKCHTLFLENIAFLKTSVNNIEISNLVLEENYLTTKFFGKNSTFNIILMHIIRYEFLLKKLRFGENAYCYNITMQFDFTKELLLCSFIFENCNLEICKKTSDELGSFLDKLEITNLMFEKYKKIATKFFESYKPFYKNFSNICDEKYFKYNLDEIKEDLFSYTFLEFSKEFLESFKINFKLN